MCIYFKAKGKVNDMGFQEFEKKYGYVLSWEDAEKKIGRKLDMTASALLLLYQK